jgi:hypothetical protein
VANSPRLAVGLDAVPGFSGDECGRGDIAFDPLAPEEPAQLVPARPGLVDAAHGSVLGELSGQPLASFGGVGKLGSEENRVGASADRGNNDVFRVDIHPDPGDRILHDRSLLYYGSGRASRPTNPRFTRWDRSTHHVLACALGIEKHCFYLDAHLGNPQPCPKKS